jgi:hypothetical protein
MQCSGWIGASNWARFRVAHNNWPHLAPQLRRAVSSFS